MTGGQNHRVITSSSESPKVRISRMSDVKIFEVVVVFQRERMKNALKQRPVLVPVDPLLIYTRFDLLELETGVRMECKPMPVFPFCPKVANEEPFGGACQVEHTNHRVHLSSHAGVNRSW